MAAGSDMHFQIPVEFLREDQTFAIDFGGSLAKIVYADFDMSDLPDKLATIRVASYPREKVDEMIKFMKENIPALQLRTMSADAAITVYVTGIGCLQFKEKLEKELNIKLILIAEMDAMVRALRYMMEYVPLEDMVHQPLKEAKIESCEFMEDILNAMEAMTKENLASFTVDLASVQALMSKITLDDVDRRKPFKATGNKLPVLIGICGSAYNFLQVGEGDKDLIINSVNSAGKSLDGKAKVFLGVESFDEFLELARKGDSRKLDMYTNDICGDCANVEGAGVYGMCSSMKHESLLFNFGKASNAAPGTSFAREDLARALLFENILNHVQIMYLQSQMSGCGHVFICGTLCTDETVHNIMTAEMTRRMLRAAMTYQHKVDVHLHFLKQGAYLGAIGTLLKPSIQF